jgi:SH3 domain-containing YSC84-like protein 1
MGPDKEFVQMNEVKRVLPQKILTACSVLLLLMVGMSWAQDQTNGQDQTSNEKQSSTQDQASTQNQSDIAKRIAASARVLDEIMATPDKGIPNKVMSDAKCIAVIPSMVKIAVGFGGSHGKGVATCRTADGWSAPAPLTLTGGSWGLQLGGEAVDLVLVVMNQQGMQALLSSKFKIGADATASAGPVGRYAGADTNWKMKSEILTYSRSRGVFAGVNLHGAAVTQDKDETIILYGKYEPFSTILAGKVRPRSSSDPFLAAVRKYSAQSGDTHTSGPSGPGN